VFAHKQEAVLLIRFCAVGMANTAVDFGVFCLLTLGGMPFLPAQAFSYTAGIANSFILNRKWTFRIRRKANTPELMKFLLVNVFSLLVSSGLLYLLRDVNHLSLWIAKLAATGGGMAVNFIGSRLWVFSGTKTKGSEVS
jgi:putative flippase GtrA